jgi:hypothetical protein
MNAPGTNPPPSDPGMRTGPLREVRVHLQLPVRVWGLDATGKPFSENVHTIEISALGARLSGNLRVQKGDVVGIQYGEMKARFRVVWLGSEENVPGAVGVECVEPGKCIWTEVLEKAAVAKPAAFAPAQPPGGAPAAAAVEGNWPVVERRRYPRFPCSGALRTQQVGTEFSASQKLTDISLGGCYGESMAPFDRDVVLDLVLEVCGQSIRARGMVRTQHPSMGNGIGFTEIAPEEWKKLVRAVQQLGGTNVVLDTPREPEIGDAIEALLSLLEKKGIHITRDEFIDELKNRMAHEIHAPGV